MTESAKGVTRDVVLAAMEMIAPIHGAEDWDNVGLLLDGLCGHPNVEDRVEAILLTIDLTPDVMEEALATDVQLVVSYHPPIFDGLKSLNSKNPKSRMLLTAAAYNISIYSPHTALDVAPGGMGDWLAEALGPGQIRAIKPRLDADQQFKLTMTIPKEDADPMRDALAKIGCGVIGNYTHCSFTWEGTGSFKGEAGSNPAVGETGELEKEPELRLEMICGTAQLPQLAAVIDLMHPYEEPAWELYPLQGKPNPKAGIGRINVLNEEIKLNDAIDKIKLYLGLEFVRVAAASKHQKYKDPIKTLAVCPGAGGALLKGLKDVDLVLTGEMRHHDILELQQSGTSVILTDHTNTERAYLSRLKHRLISMLGEEVEVLVSKSDRDPLWVT